MVCRMTLRMGQAFLQEGWQNQVKEVESLCKDEELQFATIYSTPEDQAGKLHPLCRDWSRKEHVTHYWPIRSDEKSSVRF